MIQRAVFNFCSREIICGCRTFASAVHPTLQQNVSSAAHGAVAESSNSEQKLPTTSSEDVSFATLVRRSKLLQLGDPDGRKVTGVIIRTFHDDLYIDFGGKFPCVCKRPQNNGERYILGAKVLLRLHDLELSSRFLGSQSDLTLLEADATLLGLYSNY